MCRDSGAAEGQASETLHDERRCDPDGFVQRVETYRSALRQYIGENSLRQAAREVGMSPTGLSQFLDGAEPYVPTVPEAAGVAHVALHRPAAAAARVSHPAAPREAADGHLRILRAAVQLRMDRTSGRVVAREVGVTQGTIYNFVAARVRPYGTTLARLETWYRRLVLSGGLPVGRDGVRYMLEPFLADVPDELRPAAADQLVAALIGIYAGLDLETPAWLYAFAYATIGPRKNVTTPPGQPFTVGCRAVESAPMSEHTNGVPAMQHDAESAVPDGEHQMLAAVLSELFLGVLADYEPQEWYDAAVDLLSRGAAPKLWGSLTAAHAAGLRGDPRVSAQAEAIDLLCVRGRTPAGPYDFPTELAVLVVGRDVAEMVHARTGEGIYTSPDEVVGSAMHALEFAENDPEGRRRLLRYALSLGIADAEAGRLIPAEVVFARLRDRARKKGKA